MSKKSKLKEIHTKLKQWANVVDDQEYDDLLTQFDGEITTMDDPPPPPDDGDNHPHKPNNP